MHCLHKKTEYCRLSDVIQNLLAVVSFGSLLIQQYYYLIFDFRHKAIPPKIPATLGTVLTLVGNSKLI